MPRINRIRIINFSYNNDNREIQDETYRFYDGENALLNLSNGGGKSVLVQVFLQPVIPDFKIQKRLMADYLKRSVNPSFIMIEWLLDNESRKDYLLTGIVIAPKGSNNEDSNKINYYTFMSHYDKAFEFDISCVPFAVKEQGRLNILPYERSREAVRKLAAKYREVYYFSRDDSAEYRRELMRFGIYQDEWKNIIARMNNDEGGIDELFERCATSNSVFNEWILKTVEKAVMSDQSGDTRIYELLDGLVGETLKNETYIQDQKLMSGFFEVHQNLEAQLQDICGKLEAYERCKSGLGSMYAALVRQTGQLAADREEALIRQEDLEAEKSRIAQEESSERYYAAREEADAAEELYQEENLKLREAETNLENITYERRRLQAARLYLNCEELKASIAILERQLEAQGNDDETHRMLKNLRYSLKIGYQTLLQTLEQNIMAEKAQAAKNGSDIEAVEQQIATLGQAHQSGGQRLGSLEEKLRAFQEYEEQILKQLGFDLPRNVLRELDAVALEANRRRFEQTIRAADEAILKLTAEWEHLEQRLEKNRQLLTDTQIRRIGAENHREQTTTELNKLLAEEQDCLACLERYDIEPGFLYEKDRLGPIWRQKIAELERRKNSWVLERNQIEQMAAGIRKNHIYLPEIFLAALAEADIEYISGEGYLENLAEANRQQILAGNPLLPFAVVVREKDAKQVYELPLERLLLRQLIPVITYEQLTVSYEKFSQTAIIDERLAVISAYDNRIFLDDGKRAYLEELEHQCRLLAENIRHLEAELAGIHLAAGKTESYSWSREDKADYNRRIQELLKEIEVCEQQQEILGQQIWKDDKRYKDIAGELQREQQHLADTKKDMSEFHGFLERNRDYMEHLGEFLDLEQEQAGREKQLTGLRQQRKDLWQESVQLQHMASALAIRQDEVRGQAALFLEAPAAEVLDGSVEYLRRQYDDLSRQLEHSLQDLEISLEDKRSRLAENDSDLQEFQLPAEAYQNLHYEKETERRLAKEYTQGEEAVSRRRETERAAQIAQTRTQSACDQAVRNLKTNGLTEPLGKELILCNYDNRRQKLRFEMDQQKEVLAAIAKTISLYTQLSGRTEDLIPVQTTPRLPGFVLEEDAAGHFARLKEEYHSARHAFEREVKEYTRQYSLIRSEYENRHQCITDILDSLKSLVLDDRETSYESLFYHVEEFIKKKENLRKLLDFYETQLQNITHTKRQIVDQCISYATLLYEDVKLITAKSRIRLTGKNRPVQMLKIDIPDTLDTQVHERMTAHIDNSLRLMVELSRADIEKTDKKYRDKMRAVMSSRELLNQLIGTGKIQVSVYKVDLNPNNSGMKKWEDAMAHNSGGEKFVVFFTLVSTLISYTREAAGRNEGIDMSRDSKVILMDNPFGRTSSEHLLKAVIDIARTFNIQLICLSDLNQSSITNRFALIYQLAVRKRMYSDKEMLKIGNLQVNKEGLAENERLEHARLYESYEQGSLFDFI